MAARGAQAVGRWRDRRDATLVALAVTVAIAFVAGAVVGAQQGGGKLIKGTKKADRLVGTPGDDQIRGGRGKDRGEDGVVVSRRFRGSQYTQWLWMADLWLAERLADAARG